MVASPGNDMWQNSSTVWPTSTLFVDSLIAATGARVMNERTTLKSLQNEFTNEDVVHKYNYMYVCI